MSDALQRAIRTLAQLIVSGGLTVLVDKWAGGLSASAGAWVLIGWMMVVTYAHNYLEDKGIIPTALK